MSSFISYRHTFKISHLGFAGRNVTAAFGSTVPQDLKRLRAIVRKITALTKKVTGKRSRKKGNDEDDAISGMYNVRTARSELTALSNTVYGRNTMNRKG